MAVFSALNDAEVLRRSIPGCEAIEARSPTEMTATVALKIGPIKMRLSGEVTLANIDPPHCYTIIGQGNGGAVGFASGTAEVHLAPDGDATVLTYDVTAQLGGRLAQLGSRLIEGAAQRLSTRFFDEFAALVGDPSSADIERPPEEVAP